MPKTFKQKIKLIKVLEILRTDSDEEHPLTAKQIIARLAEQGIECARKSLYDDIRTLNENGYEIMTVRSTQNKYYIADRAFDIPELRIMLDAVHFANFITEKKTKELTKKIAALAGANKAALLLHNTEYLGAFKQTNEAIFYAVDTIERAINERKKITFTYFNYDLDGNRVYRNKRAKYKVSPVSLIISENNYYLICKNDLRKELTVHRVDRMDEVGVTEEAAIDAAKLKDFEPAKYSQQTFSMFSGDLVYVTLQADNKLIDVMNDKFGLDAKKHKIDDEKFKMTVEVQVSPTFFAWLSTFGDKVKIISPLGVINEYVRSLHRSLEQYD